MKKTVILLLSFTFLSSFNNSNAQWFIKKKKKELETIKKEKKVDIKSIKIATKKCSKTNGLFPIYQDTTNGAIYLEIDKNQLEKEFIYFSYVENGLVQIRAFRGSYRGSKIFSIHKHYNNIEIKLPNTKYYFDPKNAISKAADANVNTPIIISEKIIGESKGKYLINAKAIFMDENFSTIKPNYPPGWKGFKLGNMSKTKSKVESIRNYPKNTDVRTLYVYDKSGPSKVPVSISYHHSIMEVPNNNFKPRFDDPRVGYFMTAVTDLTSASPTPYRDMIHRWNLVKKNPEAKLSEPVEPITWWIENTTPKELRPIIKEGVEQWNISFEKAGFKNAVVVKTQSDTATWDAGDIRYNVLRWTSSPSPPFGGYGPSFVNPRTGQILGADIMLEYVYVLGRLKQEKVFDIAGLGLQSEHFTGINHDIHSCQAGSAMQEQVLFVNSAFKLTDISDIDKNKFLTQSIKRLVLHEVGHTLGLNHNMKGSSIQSVEDIKNKALIEKEGMCNSVMEYPAINFALDKSTQTNFYDEKPGFYDDWVIEFGYSTGLVNENEEQKRLDKILSRSTEPKLAFGNDADDMRSAGKGIDPSVNIYDLSDDPVAYGIDRIKLVDNVLMPKLLDKFSKKNQSYAELTNAYLTLTGQKAIQLRVFTRQIGGINVNRAFEGQNSTKDPYTPVSLEKQQAAMKALATYAFSPDAFTTDEKLIRHLQKQRRGFGFFSKSEDPKLHNRVLAIHQDLLNHLLHKNVLKRIVDSELYGNKYTLDLYLKELTAAIFDADKKSKINHYRQNLQLEYTNKLIKYLNNKSVLPSTKSLVLYQLTNIKKIAYTTTTDVSSKAHKSHLKLIIEKALKV